MSMLNKPTIRVIINVTGLPNTYKTTHTDGTITYSGLFYDVYVKIKNKLSDKYKFEETYDEEFNVTKALNDIRDGKYDVGIHNFSTTTKRLKDVNFTQSIIMERDVIVYQPEPYSTLKTIGTLFTEVFMIPMSFIVVLGFIIGWLMNKFQAERNSDLNRKKGNLGLRRSIMATVATFLAEAGMMAEESPLGTISIFFTVVIMIIAMAFNTYITARVTDKVIELGEGSKYNITTITGMHILALKGQAIGDNFKRYGTKVTEMPTNVKTMIKKYLSNTKKYNGVALESSVALIVAKKYNLKMTNANFGFGDAVFAVNKNRPELLEHFNTEIEKLQEGLETERICKKYIDDSYSYLCVL